MTAVEAPLRLIVQGLSERELAKVAAFLKLGRGRLGRDWTIAFDGEAHVVLSAEDDVQTVRGLLDSPVSVLRLTDGPGDSRVGLLPKPIDYDSLIEALVATETRLGLAASPTVAAPPPAPRADAPVPVAHEPAAGLTPVKTYRLRRWPSSDLLRNDRHRTRLASFLSTRSLDLDELARLANVPRTECEAFLSALARAGLLDAKSPAAAAPRTAAAPAAAPPAASTGRADAGLFDRLRRRFGLRLGA